MILGFTKKFEDGTPTYFLPKIAKGFDQAGWCKPPELCNILDYEYRDIQHLDLKPKLHTIRKGNRWKEGMKIHMATGVRTKNYHCFTVTHCTAVQSIIIETSREWDTDSNCVQTTVRVTVDGKKLNGVDIKQLAMNDGFDDLLQFTSWFYENSEKGYFEGQLIHWLKNIRY